MAGRFTLPTPSAYDSSGNPLAGGKLSFFESGTSTPLDTYSDDDLSTANANPVVADSAGRWGDIFLKDQDYKVILKDADDTTIDTWDPVRAAEPTSTTVVSKTTTYTVTSANNGQLIEADATAGPFTITLLPAATAGNGFEVTIKKVDSSTNAVTVDADGSETIDGNTSVALSSQHDVVSVRSNGTAWRVVVLPLVRQTLPLPLDYIAGLSLSINSTDSDHDIDIAVGMARDEDDGVNIILSATITKRLDAAWAVGSGNGGLDTGTVAADSIYYGWLIRRSDTGVVDVLFSLSSSAPTMPTNYDQRHLLGNLYTDASANIAKLFVRQDEAPSTTTSVATTSGTAHDILGIPSWARTITVLFNAVSLSGTDNLLVQLGDSGGFETTGYISETARISSSAQTATSSTSGFIMAATNASGAIHGTMTLTRSPSTFWLASHSLRTDTSNVVYGAGSKSTSATLDRIRLTRTGTDTFDAGEFYVFYDG